MFSNSLIRRSMIVLAGAGVALLITACNPNKKYAQQAADNNPQSTNTGTNTGMSSNAQQQPGISASPSPGMQEQSSNTGTTSTGDNR